MGATVGSPTLWRAVRAAPVNPVQHQAVQVDVKDGRSATPTHAQSTHDLRVYMGNLRQKLEDDAPPPRHIVTETGVPYRLLVD